MKQNVTINESNKLFNRKELKLFNSIDLDSIEGIVPFHDMLNVVEINLTLTLVKKQLNLGKMSKSKLKIIPNETTTTFESIHKFPNFFIGYLNSPMQTFQIFIVFPKLFVKEEITQCVIGYYKIFIQALFMTTNELVKINVSQTHSAANNYNQVVSLNRIAAKLKNTNDENIKNHHFKCDIFL